MELKFRHRDYKAEEQVHSFRPVAAETHPLSFQSPSYDQVDVTDYDRDEFFDPLRGNYGKPEDPMKDLGSTTTEITAEPYRDIAIQFLGKEWTSYKKVLMQKFPVSKMISVSSLSSSIMKTGKGPEKPSANVHLEELDDPQRFAEEGVKYITLQEYVSRLTELKDEISRAWHANDRVTSLNLSIKVAKLLSDTSVLQLYPTLFVLATEILDMLGDMVWERIRQKAEYTEDGTLVDLPDNFQATEICTEAKETCYNWFCKVGSIRELLPRIYLELAIFHCWRYLLEQPADNLPRLVMMARGIADPLASFYCRLYLAHCAQKINQRDIGHLIISLNDMKTLLMNAAHVASAEKTSGVLSGTRSSKLGLMEAAIEYVMKCLFRESRELQVGDILMGLGLGRNRSELFGNSSCVSLVLHYLLRELPIGIICSNALDILHLIECSNDYSFDQCLNYKLLGLRLCENISHVNEVNLVMKKVIQVVSRFNSLDEYLNMVDTHIDIVLQKDMKSYLDSILDGIFERITDDEIGENELSSLQSIVLKLLNHFDNLEKILQLDRFNQILSVMPGSSRTIINMRILSIATRSSYVRDPTTIQFLFEVSRSLHDYIDLSTIKDKENNHCANLIFRFIHMVDYGSDGERHLAFLVQCRGVFGSMSEVKETIVHSSNLLVVKAMRSGSNYVTFVKSCIACSEVTIPSIPSHLKQLNLYLETAEVALMAGLVSHSDGLVDSALRCLHSVDLLEGSRMPKDIDGFQSTLCKFCSLIVMIPGNIELGVTSIPRNMFSILSSLSWMLPCVKAKALCALILTVAALSQNNLPYHAIHDEVKGNDSLFYCDQQYLQEFLSFAVVLLQCLIDTILQEPIQAAGANLALDACNAIAASFEVCQGASDICSKLVETAKLSLSSDNKYLQSTVEFLKNRGLIQRGEL
ncbi:VPS35 endosomal protein-sorting factor-like isoform X2 [Capsicum chacoense]